MAAISIFKIYANYRGAKVWHAKADGGLVGWSSITLDKGLTRKRRYDEISKWLREQSKLIASPYVPTVREGVR